MLHFSCRTYDQLALEIPIHDAVDPDDLLLGYCY